MNCTNSSLSHPSEVSWSYLNETSDGGESTSNSLRCSKRRRCSSPTSALILDAGNLNYNPERSEDVWLYSLHFQWGHLQELTPICCREDFSPSITTQVSAVVSLMQTKRMKHVNCVALMYSSFVQQHNYTTRTGLCIHMHNMFSILIAASYNILFLLYTNNYFYYGLICYGAAQFIVSASHDVCVMLSEAARLTTTVLLLDSKANFAGIAHQSTRSNYIF